MPITDLEKDMIECQTREGFKKGKCYFLDLYSGYARHV